ncbi:MAG: DNA starvation/stationary phase protection protein [Elusimicrobia bacterium]|nr:DNA starvation/stationary phase protection protein [Elusimicrobiota bacterium]
MKTQSRPAAVLEALDGVLADEFVLYVKTRNFHWNVEGPRFAEFHKLFEAQYGQLSGFVDQVAERSRALGGYALGSAADLLRHASLKEQSGREPSDSEMVSQLAQDHAALSKRLTHAIAACAEADPVTADLLTGIAAEHDKTAWMLRSLGVERR